MLYGNDIFCCQLDSVGGMISRVEFAFEKLDLMQR